MEEKQANKIVGVLLLAQYKEHYANTTCSSDDLAQLYRYAKGFQNMRIVKQMERPMYHVIGLGFADARLTGFVAERLMKRIFSDASGLAFVPGKEKRFKTEYGNIVVIMANSETSSDSENKLLEAADPVCLYCTESSEETCKDCPVR